MNVLESEFLEYQTTPDEAHEQWSPRFKHLEEFGKVLLLIPHSNSYCESIYLVQSERSALTVTITFN